MSFLYTGTGALKTDFTKTGKRTIKGALQDGKNSIERYFLNNLFDGHNQNCVDLLLGKLKPKQQNYKLQSVNPIIKMAIFVILVMIYRNRCSYS